MFADSLNAVTNYLLVSHSAGMSPRPMFKIMFVFAHSSQFVSPTGNSMVSLYLLNVADKVHIFVK